VLVNAVWMVRGCKQVHIKTVMPASMAVYAVLNGAAVHQVSHVTRDLFDIGHVTSSLADYC
jgi:hypothetical protein